MRCVESSRPLCTDVCTVFCGKAGRSLTCLPSAAISGISFTIPGDGINVTAVANDNHCSSVGLDRFCRGILERKVCRIKFTRSCSIGTGSLCSHCDAAAGCCLLGYCSQIGISVIISVLDHVNDLVITLCRVPLSIQCCVCLKLIACAC